MTLYATITIDSISTGHRTARCQTEKPTNLSHAEFAIYRLEVSLPGGIKYSDTYNDFVPHPCVQIRYSDYISAADEGETAWLTLGWSTTRHTLCLTDPQTGKFFAELKGAHVTAWEEV